MAYQGKYPIVFHNALNYDHFIVKVIAKESKVEFSCLGKNTEKKNKTFSVPITIEVKRINKNGKEIRKKQYLTDCSLFTVQDLWQAYYLILLMIFLKEFIQLNIDTDMAIKN